jgi:hypothetical protein
MATYYMKASGAGSKDGSDWDNAWSESEYTSYIQNDLNAGDIIYVLSGSYTMGNTFEISLDATADNPLQVIGVSDEALTEAEGDDRPLWAFGTVQHNATCDYLHYRNLRIQFTDTDLFKLGSYARFENIKFEGNTQVGAYSIVTNCEFTDSTDTTGGSLITGSDCIIRGCYFHDMPKGIDMESTAVLTIDFNIFDTISGDAITCGFMGGNNCRISNNTFYNCGKGIDFTGHTTVANVFILNNNFSDCTIGLDLHTDASNNYLDYNNWYNNSTDLNNENKGSNATAYNPQFTNASGGNFSLQSGSQLIGRALSIKLGISS